MDVLLFKFLFIVNVMTEPEVGEGIVEFVCDLLDVIQ